MRLSKSLENQIPSYRVGGFCLFFWCFWVFLIWAAGFRILGLRLLVVFLDDRPASISRSIVVSVT